MLATAMRLPGDDLVVDVGDAHGVHNVVVEHVGEDASEYVQAHVRARVPQVRSVVHCGPCGVWHDVNVHNDCFGSCCVLLVPEVLACDHEECMECLNQLHCPACCMP
jgi:hypothetical protein